MRCLGRTEADRKITKRAVVVDAEMNEPNKTTRGSERSSVLERRKEKLEKKKESQKKFKKGLDTSRHS
ncbi:MAG: hypothetical protein DMG78_33140 [Acidobacteria bacterium]|nr:MAG: hypothetical protein DMG78_33140 [Acidobacteriota bacterium]